MSSSAPPEQPPEREQEDKSGRNLTLVEHLQEVRYRLIVSSVAVVIGLAISAYFGSDLIAFLKHPAEAGSQHVVFQAIEPGEKLSTYFRVALLGGVILAMPVIVYQVLQFVSPGLKPNEKRWLYGTVIGATLLFLAGVAFAYYIALPRGLGFLLDFGGADIAETNIRISSYIDFVTRLIFWMGVAFETPLVLMFLARFGIMNATRLRRSWRYAIVIAFVVAAIVTPTPDPVNQTIVAVPIIGLYVLGVVLAYLAQPRRSSD